MWSLSAEATAEGTAGTCKDKALGLPTSIRLHLEPAPTIRGDEPENTQVFPSQNLPYHLPGMPRANADLKELL